jgi:tetratricopeptide (TPR) repeat protein
VVRGGAFGLPLLLAILFLSAGALQTQPDLSSGWPLRVLLGLLGGLGVGLALIVRLREGEWMSLWLVTVGLLVGLGTQIVFVRDHLSGGDWERMNTVFKFGIQQWTLWAVGGATGVALIFRLLRRYEITTGIWLGTLVMLLAACLVYPLVGIPSRLSTRFDSSLPLTLDGLAFMEHAQYTIERDKVVKQIDLSADAEAIDWLKQNIAGTPIVATSEAEFYRTYGVRIAANTGLPTILGRLHEDEQRPAGPVIARDQDVKDLYNTTDPVLASQLLATYRVDYVYVGPVEQAVYEPAGLAKFETMRGGALELVYENKGVRIYAVKREAISGVLYIDQEPQMVTEDPQIVALRAQVAGNPQDSGLAFGLGQRLVELNRVDEAVSVLQTAATANPQDVPLHHFLGDLLAQLGQNDAAITAWQQAIDAQPTASNINKLGQGLVRLGRWEQAERVLQQALAADSSFVDPYVYLGELYRSRNGDGDRERAITAYQRYLELAPADAPWRQLATTQLQELGQ